MKTFGRWKYRYSAPKLFTYFGWRPPQNLVADFSWWLNSANASFYKRISDSENRQKKYVGISRKSCDSQNWPNCRGRSTKNGKPLLSPMFGQPAVQGFVLRTRYWNAVIYAKKVCPSFFGLAWNAVFLEILHPKHCLAKPYIAFLEGTFTATGKKLDTVFCDAGGIRRKPLSAWMSPVNSVSRNSR